MIMNKDMKTCIHCKEEKDLSLFVKDKRNPDGCANYCRECRKNIERKYNERRKKDAKYSDYQRDYNKNKRCPISVRLNRFTAFVQSFRKQHILPQRIYIKKCLVTGELFTTRYNSKKYSEEGNKLIANFKSMMFLCRKHYEGEGQKNCVQCGKSFMPFFGTKDRCCSDKCKKELRSKHRRLSKYYRRARIKSLPYERIDPIKVFERDGWRCQLTGVKTPKRLRGTLHDNAPELDHIIPLSQGGSHTYDNVQCASRKANLEKGNKVIGQLTLKVG